MKIVHILLTILIESAYGGPWLEFYGINDTKEYDDKGQIIPAGRLNNTEFFYKYEPNVHVDFNYSVRFITVFGFDPVDDIEYIVFQIPNEKTEAQIDAEKRKRKKKGEPEAPPYYPFTNYTYKIDPYVKYIRDNPEYCFFSGELPQKPIQFKDGSPNCKAYQKLSCCNYRQNMEVAVPFSKFLRPECR